MQSGHQSLRKSQKKGKIWKLIFENHLYENVGEISEILMEENIKSEEEKKVCTWSISIWKYVQHRVIGEMQIKAQRDTASYPLQWLYSKRLTIASVHEDMGQNGTPPPPHCQWECKMV